MYRIREVDPFNDEIADTIRLLNGQTPDFPDLSDDELEGGYWWLAYLAGEPVAFAGLVPSKQFHNVGYYKRAGVDPQHRGRGLQVRLMRVRELKARRLGYSHVVSECTETVYSANNFIRSGFKLYEPRKPWAFKNSLYWIKELS